jgi:sugar fermentation stimulation protein A
LPPPDPMALPAQLTRCVLVQRYKRFLADVELPSGDVVTAHCPNPVSMRGMGVDARPDALVSTAPLGSKRKLPYTLEALQVDRGTWAGVNTVKPNAVVGAWLEARGADAVALFREYAFVRREVKYGVGGGSRIDFVLEYGGDAAEALPYYVEVKNVTTARDDDGGAAGAVERVAVFPDSKTERGLKHLRELADVVERGDWPRVRSLRCII